MTRDVRRIAVFRALHLGDLVLSVPALRSLRAGFPEAEISLIGLPCAEAFCCQFGHYVDRFVAFPGDLALEHPGSDPAWTARFIQEQRAYEYDLVIQMHGDGVGSNRLVAELEGWITAGYYVGEPPDELTVAAPYPAGEHEVLRNLSLVGLLGCPDCGTDLEFPLFLEDRRQAVSLLGRLPAERPIVGLYAGSPAPGQRWSAEYFAAVADTLVRCLHVSVVIVGAAEEKEHARAVVDRMESVALDLTGRTSFGGLAALLSRLDLFIATQGDLTQVARAVGVPSMTLFADSEQCRPLPMWQSVLPNAPAGSQCGFTDHLIVERCLSELRPDAVVSLAGRLLQSSRNAGQLLPPQRAAVPLGSRDRGRP